MNYSLSRQLKTLNFKALIILIALVSMASSLMANDKDIDGNRIFDFYIKNMGDEQIQVIMTPGSCYEGRPRKKKTITIEPKKEFKMIIARVQGNGCDGRQGYFDLEFSPSIGNKYKQSFQFSNSGGLAFVETHNPYPGSLLPKSGNSYTYETFSPLKCRWELICTSTQCSNSVVTTEVESMSKTVTLDKTVENALSTSVTAGIDYGAFSGGSTAEASTRTTITNSMKSCISKSGTVEKTDLGLSIEALERYGITAMYQYVGEIRYGGQTYIIKTQHYTFTTSLDVGAPTWLPTDDEDRRHVNLELLQRAREGRN
jgi:hypothetical protein